MSIYYLSEIEFEKPSKRGHVQVYLRLFLVSLLFEVSWVLSAGHFRSSDFYKERNISYNNNNNIYPIAS